MPRVVHACCLPRRTGYGGMDWPSGKQAPGPCLPFAAARGIRGGCAWPRFPNCRQGIWEKLVDRTAGCAGALPAHCHTWWDWEGMPPGPCRGGQRGWEETRDRRRPRGRARAALTVLAAATTAAAAAPTRRERPSEGHEGREPLQARPFPCRPYGIPRGYARPLLADCRPRGIRQGWVACLPAASRTVVTRKRKLNAL